MARETTARPAPAGRLRSNRDFQLLWAGQAVSMLGSRISVVAYPLLVLSMTRSPAIAGVVGFLGTLPYILFQLPAGAVADRVNRRRMMILCDVGRLLALGSIPLAAWLGRLTLVQVAVAACVEGILFVFFRLGEGAAIRLIVDPSQHSLALAQNEARMRAAGLLGSPIGGYLFGLGRALPFLADALTYLASLGTLLLIRAPFEEQRTGEPSHVLADIREGVAWLWHQHYVLIVNLAASATNALFQVLILVVIVAEQRRGASSSQIGIVLGGFGLGGVAGSLFGGWLTRRVPANRIVLVTIWVWPALTPLAALVSNPALLVLALGGLSFMGASWNIAGNTIFFRLVPDRLIGRVSSAGSLTAYGALPVGSLLGGLLVQGLGPQVTGLVTAGAMLAVAVLTTLAPSVRSGPDV
jgi:predicted MFS family arabinose efflux permease